MKILKNFVLPISVLSAFIAVSILLVKGLVELFSNRYAGYSLDSSADDWLGW